MISAILASLFFSAIELDGVVAEQLTAEARVDAYNVRLGDPMTLTVDFIGVADFAALHPPALAAAVDQKTWKIDDISAKTETYQDARRLVYRMRPMKAGLLEFPSLEFSCALARGKGETTFATKKFPVHVKAASQIALAGIAAALEDDVSNLPMPDGIIVTAPEELSADDAFAWRKACAKPTAEAFARFDFAAARYNEAACAIVEGKWARALKIYSVLEWSEGQTPAIERGIVAALSRKAGGERAELPMWRQVMRPWLKYAWAGRLAWVIGVLAAIILFFALCGKLVKRLACVAIVAAALSAQADPFGIFDEVNRMMEEQQRMMDEMMKRGGGTTVINSSNGGTTFINGVKQEPVKVKVSLDVSRGDIRVGEPFDFIISLEYPKKATIEASGMGRPIVFSEETGMVFVSNRIQQLKDGVSSDPSNVVRRLSVKVRYDTPMKTPLSVTFNGMSVMRSEGRRGGFFSSTFSTSFSETSAPIYFEVKPLPTDNQPAEFRGAVGKAFRLRRSVDRNKVSTNDVVIVTSTLEYDGFVPPDFATGVVERRPGSLKWKDFFVADGTPAVPSDQVVYYDTDTRTYKTAATGKIPLVYRGDDDDQTPATVAVGAAAENASAKAIRLRFAPSETALVIGETDGKGVVVERQGRWARIDDGERAGWALAEELKQ